jgi:hypothetical protein
VAQQKLLDRTVDTAVTTEAIQARIAKAEDAAREAEQAWRAEAFSVEAGGDPRAEAAAEANLQNAKREVARLQAVLLEVEALKADEARAAQKAQEDAEDAQVIQAYEAWSKAANPPPWLQEIARRVLAMLVAEAANPAIPEAKRLEIAGLLLTIKPDELATAMAARRQTERQDHD